MGNAHEDPRLREGGRIFGGSRHARAHVCVLSHWHRPRCVYVHLCFVNPPTALTGISMKTSAVANEKKDQSCAFVCLFVWNCPFPP